MEEKRDDSGEIYGWTCDCCGNQIQISLETCRDCSAWNPQARKEAAEKRKLSPETKLRIARKIIRAEIIRE